MIGCRPTLDLSAAQSASAGKDSAENQTAASGEATSRELIYDRQFAKGFILLDPKPGKRVPYGALAGQDPNQKPAWDLAQWSSRFPLKPETPAHLADGALRYANEGKSVTLGPPGSKDADVALAINAKAEYGHRARRKGEPWVHLLVQQNFEKPPALSKLRTARLHLEARLLQSKLFRTDDYSADLHAAQFQMFLMVQNRNHQSPGYGHLLWFGIPVYDDRSRFPKAYQAQDFGGTNMFIFTPGGETCTQTSAHDGKWITIQKDVLPLIREGLHTAWARGFLSDSKSLADYHITGMNLGWEVPGIFHVAMQVRNLSLQAE